MSCNGCRVLRKGCSESCILRPCLQWIDTAQAQANATVFVAKFFGRAGLMSFISAVTETQRPALFQSLLFEACGRTVNPVGGAVGLLSAGKWHLCQSAVETVLRGGTLHPLAEISAPDTDDSSEADPSYGKGFGCGVAKLHPSDLDLGLAAVPLEKCIAAPASRKRRPSTPSMESEGSVTTSFKSEGDRVAAGGDRKLLNLFG
ncbi:LOB domain-containing protein 37 [Cinnamomum micranthum f. kanehirae]|uniref:LOB domain-containing protein 37 n=1 Tax=Cinnamomum micranthum f. kanehirae TaxID=337451 RepID=A0A3S3MV26_9MAGN|nr:LOB domain-containing protein 37 [Cinnamomum micranthum f. kanehirae]